MPYIRLALKDPSKETPEIRAFLDECARRLNQEMDIKLEELIAYGLTVIKEQ